MPVGRQIRPEESDGGLSVLLRLRGIPPSEDTLEPLERVYEEVIQRIVKLLARRSTPNELDDKERNVLRL